MAPVAVAPDHGHRVVARRPRAGVGRREADPGRPAVVVRDAADRRDRTEGHVRRQADDPGPLDPGVGRQHHAEPGRPRLVDASHGRPIRRVRHGETAQPGPGLVERIDRGHLQRHAAPADRHERPGQDLGRVARAQRDEAADVRRYGARSAAGPCRRDPGSPRPPAGSPRRRGRPRGICPPGRRSPHPGSRAPAVRRPRRRRPGSRRPRRGRRPPGPGRCGRPARPTRQRGRRPGRRSIGRRVSRTVGPSGEGACLPST